MTTKPHDECGFPDSSKRDWNDPEKVSEHYYWCMGGLPGMERGLLRLPWICLKIRRKHHPSPWDLLSKIAIAHSSLGRLRDLLPGRPRDLLLSCLYRLLRKKSDNEGGGGFKQLDGGVALAPQPAAGFWSDPTRPWNSFSSTMSSMKRQRRFSARRRLKCRSNCYEPFAWTLHTRRA